MTEVDVVENVLRNELRIFIEDNFLYMRPDLELQDDDRLLGLIDSLGFVELVEEIQSRYGIELEDVEITEANLGSITALVSFIGVKRAS